MSPCLYEFIARVMGTIWTGGRVKRDLYKHSLRRAHEGSIKELLGKHEKAQARRQEEAVRDAEEEQPWLG